MLVQELSHHRVKNSGYQTRTWVCEFLGEGFKTRLTRRKAVSVSRQLKMGINSLLDHISQVIEIQAAKVFGPVLKS
jgi:hypothetical protein